MNDSRKRLIFVSCGQRTESERELGKLIRVAINETEGCSAYFADAVHDFQGLSANIFDALRRCSAMIAVLQARGTVTHDDGSGWGTRSSVWVNQEVAILAFRQFLETRKIPILVFKDPDVRLEGAMTSLVVNPVVLDVDSVVDAVKQWVASISGSLHAPEADAAFAEKWAQLSEKTIYVLECVEREGGADVTDDVIWESLTRYGMGNDDAAMATAKEEFRRTGLVRLTRDGSSRGMSIHPAWRLHIARALDRWRADRTDTE